MIKCFKLSCAKAQTQFSGMEVRSGACAAYFEAFTPNTVIMVVSMQPDLPSAACAINIAAARRHFAEWVDADASGVASVL